ncbi:MAG TPA: MBL fold metallo-hydrolase [Gemmatimonadaceae bacterium]
MLLKRFFHEGLAQASYLVGCQQTGEALIVDANRDIAQYVAAARAAGLRITHVTETHIHADYVSGSRELAAATGATLFLSAEGGQDWQYRFAREVGATFLRDGDTFAVGNVRIEAMHTPGHTPEHLTFLVADTLASTQPIGALTGDFIFVSDVGRPDLLERVAGVEGSMRGGAKLLFESLRRFTERCPDWLQLWPGHGAGSACGKSLGAMPQTTLGYEKLTNWAFQIDREEAFVEAVLEGQPEAPIYFATMKRMNRDGPPPLGYTGPRQLAPETFESVVSREELVIDLRRADEFASSHVPGTISIPLTRAFAGYAGWVLPYDRDLYLLSGGTDEELVQHATRELAMIGLDRVVGWFGFDAVAAWTASGGVTVATQRVAPTDVARRLAEGALVVDVRSTTEWRSGHVAGSLHVPLGRLVSQMAEKPRSQPVVLICETGSRSAIGASLLTAAGFTDVTNVTGGLADWRREGLPLEVDTVVFASAT